MILVRLSLDDYIVYADQPALHVLLILIILQDILNYALLLIQERKWVEAKLGVASIKEPELFLSPCLDYLHVR
jgi:hypothetical protein